MMTFVLSVKISIEIRDHLFFACPFTYNVGTKNTRAHSGSNSNIHKKNTWEEEENKYSIIYLTKNKY